MVYQGIQLINNCNPILKPDPVNETQWNGTIDEIICANIIMRDISETVATLLSPMGEDHTILSWAEVQSNDLSRLNYTDHDKMVLRQFEGAAIPAKKFSKFIQYKRNTWSYVYESRLALEISCSDTLPYTR